MKEAKFTISVLLFIGLLILGLIVCYYTGRVLTDTMVETDKLPWILKGLTVFLGGLLWVGLSFFVAIMAVIYDSFKKLFK